MATNKLSFLVLCGGLKLFAEAPHSSLALLSRHLNLPIARKLPAVPCFYEVAHRRSTKPFMVLTDSRAARSWASS
jgi:hypothetical protein